MFSLKESANWRKCLEGDQKQIMKQVTYCQSLWEEMKGFYWALSFFSEIEREKSYGSPHEFPKLWKAPM